MPADLPSAPLELPTEQPRRPTVGLIVLLAVAGIVVFRAASPRQWEVETLDREFVAAYLSEAAMAEVQVVSDVSAPGATTAAEGDAAQGSDSAVGGSVGAEGSAAGLPTGFTLVPAGGADWVAAWLPLTAAHELYLADPTSPSTLPVTASAASAPSPLRLVPADAVTIPGADGRIERYVVAFSDPQLIDADHWVARGVSSAELMARVLMDARFAGIWFNGTTPARRVRVPAALVSRLELVTLIGLQQVEAAAVTGATPDAAYVQRAVKAYERRAPFEAYYLLRRAELAGEKWISEAAIQPWAMSEIDYPGAQQQAWRLFRTLEADGRVGRRYTSVGTAIRGRIDRTGGPR